MSLPEPYTASGPAEPAAEYYSTRLDFNHALRPFPACEHEFRYKGNGMEEHFIQNGDLLIIDRSVSPKDGCIAVVIFQNSFLCTQLLFSKKWNCFVFKKEKRWERALEVYGVVTYSIHTLSGKRL